jgi:hypothetical protein
MLTLLMLPTAIRGKIQQGWDSKSKVFAIMFTLFIDSLYILPIAF